jgi:Mrp family chromosome partitioning ATPase/capsular polysaccharide biosynthesis protein
VGFEEQVRVIWRQRFWLVGLSLLAAIAVFIWASTRDTTYSTWAVIGVTPGPVIAGNAVNVDTVSYTAKQYEGLVGSDAVLTSGAAVAEKGTTLRDMRERVSGASTAGAGTVTVNVKGSDAEETARVAAAIANATIVQGKTDQEARRNASLDTLKAERDALRAQLAQTAADAPERPQIDSQYQSVVSDIAAQQAAPYDAAQLLQAPAVPKGPLGPGAKSLAIFAFLAVLVLGGEGIVIWSRWRRRSSEWAEEEEAADAPVGAAPAAPAAPVVVERVVIAKAPSQKEREKREELPRVPIHSLAGTLTDALLVSILEGHRLIGVVGSSDLPATNEVTVAVAKDLAAQGLSVLVVEGHMAHPTLASRLSIRSQAGLTDVLAGGATLERAQRQTRQDGLLVLPAGRPVDRPDALIGVDNVQRVLSSSGCDVVLVSLPPSMAHRHRDAIAAQLHGIVLAVRDGHMRDRQVKAARHDLAGLNNILIAVGLVDVVPNPDLEIVGRKVDRAPRRAASTSPADEADVATGGVGVPSAAADDAESAEPTESIEPTESAENIESIEPVESPESIEPVETQDVPHSSANGHHEWVEESSARDSLPHS